MRGMVVVCYINKIFRVYFLNLENELFQTHKGCADPVDFKPRHIINRGLLCDFILEAESDLESALP